MRDLPPGQGQGRHQRRRRFPAAGLRAEARHADGESLAVVVLTAVEGQRVGTDLGTQGLSDPHEVTRKALRRRQAKDGDSVP